METRNKLLEALASAEFEDSFGRSIIRTSTITEQSIALLEGRVLLCQSNDETLDTGEFVDIAVMSTVASPLVFIELTIIAQTDAVTLELYEGGAITGGSAPVCIQPNRLMPSVVPNSEILKGTPLTPLTGTLGTALTGPDGWPIPGINGTAASDWVNSTVDIGGFICAPMTWYVLRVTNKGAASRPMTVSLKYIDPSTPT